MLRESAVALVRSCPQAILLAMTAIRKSVHWFSFHSYMGMGLRLVALWAVGALLLLAISKLACASVLTKSSCKTFHMKMNWIYLKMNLYCRWNTFSYMYDFTQRLILTQRHEITQKWPMEKINTGDKALSWLCCLISRLFPMSKNNQHLVSMTNFKKHVTLTSSAMDATVVEFWKQRAE